MVGIFQRMPVKEGDFSNLGGELNVVRNAVKIVLFPNIQ